MPELVKVGHTAGEVSERLRQLNTTGVPTPFNVAASFTVQNGAACEKEIHKALREYRLRSEREFFRISVALAVEISIDIILESMRAGQSAEDRADSEGAHDLEDIQVLVMQMLAHDSRRYGMAAETMAERGELGDGLTVEYKLALLKE